MISIRHFKPEDNEASRGLFLHGQEDFAESYLHTAEDRTGFREFLDGAITRDLANIQRSYVERAGSNFWIAELEGKAVGCIGIYRRSDEEAEIRRLAVDRSVRRMGIASRLLDLAEEFARDAGYVRTTVWTANHLTAAMSFLAHRGYREIEDHAFPHTSLTLYLYALDL
jgi:N-acetylglutamate synthase-like GNAT family acetyltransferase